MNNKGFSVIELLAVILVLAAISIIVIPSIKGYLEESAEKSYKQNVAEIEKAAREWNIVYGNTVSWNLNSETGVKTYKLKLDDLKKTEFIANEYIKNPLEEDDIEMTGCVIITLSTSDIYTYKYDEGCVSNE